MSITQDVELLVKAVEEVEEAISILKMFAKNMQELAPAIERFVRPPTQTEIKAFAQEFPPQGAPKKETPKKLARKPKEAPKKEVPEFGKGPWSAKRTEEAVCIWLKHMPSVTAARLADAIGAGQPHVRKVLYSMEERGILEEVPAPKNDPAKRAVWFGYAPGKKPADDCDQVPAEVTKHG